MCINPICFILKVSLNKKCLTTSCLGQVQRFTVIWNCTFTGCELELQKCLVEKGLSMQFMIKERNEVQKLTWVSETASAHHTDLELIYFSAVQHLR